ncbi:MAG: sugar O-acetyltransferase [Oscillospiraceae bacterium]|nr:sugar O-acetyltransferase [Oscillospiraceae bacterium]
MTQLHELNQMPPGARRAERVRAFFGGAGEDLYIELPFRANWGCNTYWGRGCYANFNLTLVDDGKITIGDNALLAPNVVITTTGHAVDPALRRRYIQFSLPVTIGDNVWIGANAVILPGVTIGDNAVIGAGSVVSRDVPPNVVAVGSPCRVLREIGDRDRETYFRGRTLAPGEYGDLLSRYESVPV